MAMTDLAALVQDGRPAPAVRSRIGRHQVLVEDTPFGTSVYRIRGDRVLTMRANKGFRDDIAAALLDAVDDLVDGESRGARVHLRPIDVSEFPLDRAALLGPGQSDFFGGRPSLDRCGLQVIPVHRSEAAAREECDTFQLVRRRQDQCVDGGAFERVDPHAGLADGDRHEHEP
jgi:hypothetical protein